MSSSDLYKILNATSSTSSYGSGPSGVEIWGIIALILSIVGAILLFCLFANAKTSPKGKFVKWLKDFLNFKVMWIEAILKMTYYFATFFVVLTSFNYLPFGGYGVLMFFGQLILGPVLVRVLYEASIMFVMIWRNTRDIAKNTEKK